MADSSEEWLITLQRLQRTQQETEADVARKTQEHQATADAWASRVVQTRVRHPAAALQPKRWQAAPRGVPGPARGEPVPAAITRDRGDQWQPREAPSRELPVRSGSRWSVMGRESSPITS